MEETTKQEFSKVGINYETAMQRLMNDEELYFTCLKQYVLGDSFEQMKKAVANNDIKAAFEAGHALKGVSANLSLDGINEILNPLVEILRAGSLENVQEGLDKLEPVYNEIIEIINKYCK